MRHYSVDVVFYWLEFSFDLIFEDFLRLTRFGYGNGGSCRLVRIAGQKAIKKRTVEIQGRS